MKHPKHPKFQKNRKYYAKWYQPQEIPNLYRLRLKSKSTFLWMKNITRLYKYLSQVNQS